jgi:hypothetical protein
MNETAGDLATVAPPTPGTLEVSDLQARPTAIRTAVANPYPKIQSSINFPTTENVGHNHHC